MKLNKSSLILMAILLTTSCTNPGSTLKLESEKTISVNKFTEPDTELDKEYVFSSKALTKNYFKRKLDKWLNPLDGVKLTKELAYARLKHPTLYNELMTEFPPMYTAINIAQEIIDRKNLEPLFKEFIEMANPYPAIPVASAATDITSTSFRANWNSANNANSYTLYLTDTGNNTTSPYQLGNVTTYELTGLNSNSSYSYYVKSNNNAGTSDASSVIPVNTLIPAPGAPVASAATEITPNSFTANWSMVNGADTYTLYLTDTGNNTTTPYEAGNANSYSLTGLNSSTSYSYYVKANNSTGPSPASDTIPVTTLIPIPDAPTATAATNITPTSFIANWGFVNGADSYTLYVTDSGSNITHYDLGNVNSLEITGLTGSTAYSYYVTATNTTGTSSQSNTIQATTLINIPDIPVAGAATAVTPTSFTANWSASNNATSYTLYVVDSLANTTQYDLGDVTSKNVTGLNSNASYSYYVTATNSTGTSAASETIPVTTLFPAAPVSGSFTATTSSITLNWSQVAQATGYKIYKDSNPTAITTITPGTILTFTDNDMAKDEHHTYKIYSLIGAVESTAFLTINASTIQGEFKVSTYSTSVQSKSKIAMDSNGNYVVVWHSNGQDGSLYGIYAQRYNNTGAKVGPEFKVNTTTLNNQIQPSVAMDSDGDFVISWQGEQAVTGYDIYIQRYNSSGNTVGTQQMVNTYTTSHQKSSRVAMDSDGDFVVTWHSNLQDNSLYGIYAQRYNNSGNKVGPEFQVNTYTNNYQLAPSIGMDSGGDFIIAWHSAGEDGSGYGIYAQRYNPSGGTVGTEFKVNTFTNSEQMDPAVAMDSLGNSVIAWHSFSQEGADWGTYAQRYNTSGNTVGAEFRVNTYLPSHQTYPSVAMDNDGDFVIAWSSNLQDGENYGIYGQRYNSSGNTVGPEFHVTTYTTNNQKSSGIAIDSDGDFAVTWSSFGQDGDGYGIFGQRYDSSGNPK
jgi:hypothetical protein